MADKENRHKIYQSISVTAQHHSENLKTVCSEAFKNIRIQTLIEDLASKDSQLRNDSCYVIGRLLDVSSGLDYKPTPFVLSSIISGLVLALHEVKSSHDALNILWSLRRPKLVENEAICAYLKPLLEVCKKVCVNVKSEVDRHRPSYATAVAALQLIHRLLQLYPVAMSQHIQAWFSLLIPYISHRVEQLRTWSDDVLQAGQTELIQHSSKLHSIVLSRANTKSIMNQMCTVMEPKESEQSRIKTLKSWMVLVRICKDQIKDPTTINLFVMPFNMAFSKSLPALQTQAFRAWSVLIECLPYHCLVEKLVIKQMLIPLTRSNRGQKKEPVTARINCWIVLIVRLGKSLEKYFTEVCQPLLTFLCEVIDTDPVSEHQHSFDIILVGVLLNFLKQTLDHDVYKFSLHEAPDAFRLNLCPVTVADCGKTLISSMSLCLSGKLEISGDQQVVMSDLVKGWESLIEYIHTVPKNLPVYKEMISSCINVIRTSILVRHRDHILNFVAPLAAFPAEVLSSPTYVPSGSAILLSTNPAILLLSSLLEAEPEPSDRFSELSCELICKGTQSEQRKAKITYLNSMMKLIMDKPLPRSSVNNKAFIKIWCACATGCKEIYQSPDTSLNSEESPILLLLKSALTPLVSDHPNDNNNTQPPSIISEMSSVWETLLKEANVHTILSVVEALFSSAKELAGVGLTTNCLVIIRQLLNVIQNVTGPDMSVKAAILGASIPVWHICYAEFLSKISSEREVFTEALELYSYILMEATPSLQAHIVSHSDVQLRQMMTSPHITGSQAETIWSTISAVLTSCKSATPLLLVGLESRGKSVQLSAVQKYEELKSGLEPNAELSAAVQSARNQCTPKKNPVIDDVRSPYPTPPSETKTHNTPTVATPKQHTSTVATPKRHTPTVATSTHKESATHSKSLKPNIQCTPKGSKSDKPAFGTPAWFKAKQVSEAKSPSLSEKKKKITKHQKETFEKKRRENLGWALGVEQQEPDSQVFNDIFEASQSQLRDNISVPKPNNNPSLTSASNSSEKGKRKLATTFTGLKRFKSDDNLATPLDWASGPEGNAAASSTSQQISQISDVETEEISSQVVSESPVLPSSIDTFSCLATPNHKTLKFAQLPTTPHHPISSPQMNQTSAQQCAETGLISLTPCKVVLIRDGTLDTLASQETPIEQQQVAVGSSESEFSTPQSSLRFSTVEDVIDSSQDKRVTESQLTTQDYSQSSRHSAKKRKPVSLLFPDGTRPVTSGSAYASPATQDDVVDITDSDTERSVITDASQTQDSTQTEDSQGPRRRSSRKRPSKRLSQSSQSQESQKTPTSLQRAGVIIPKADPTINLSSPLFKSTVAFCAASFSMKLTWSKTTRKMNSRSMKLFTSPPTCSKDSQSQAISTQNSQPDCDPEPQDVTSQEIIVATQTEDKEADTQASLSCSQSSDDVTIVELVKAHRASKSTAAAELTADPPTNSETASVIEVPKVQNITESVSSDKQSTRINSESPAQTSIGNPPKSINIEVPSCDFIDSPKVVAESPLTVEEGTPLESATAFQVEDADEKTTIELSVPEQVVETEPANCERNSTDRGSHQDDKIDVQHVVISANVNSSGSITDHSSELKTIKGQPTEFETKKGKIGEKKQHTEEIYKGNKSEIVVTEAPGSLRERDVSYSDVLIEHKSPQGLDMNTERNDLMVTLSTMPEGDPSDESQVVLWDLDESADTCLLKYAGEDTTEDNKNHSNAQEDPESTDVLSNSTDHCDFKSEGREEAADGIPDETVLSKNPFESTSNAEDRADPPTPTTSAAHSIQHESPVIHRLKLSNTRSALMLQKSIQKNSSGSPINSKMSAVQTQPATPKSKRMAKLGDFDFMPPVSPQGSILKRRSVELTMDSSQSKKVKFSLPGGANSSDDKYTLTRKRQACSFRRGLAESDSAEGEFCSPLQDDDPQPIADSPTDEMETAELPTTVSSDYSATASDPALSPSETVGSTPEADLCRTESTTSAGVHGNETAKSSSSCPDESSPPAYDDIAPLAPDFKYVNLPVELVLPQLPSSIELSEFLVLLKSNGITTISDLACLTESQLQTLPVLSANKATVSQAITQAGIPSLEALELDDTARLGVIRQLLDCDLLSSKQRLNSIQSYIISHQTNQSSG